MTDQSNLVKLLTLGLMLVLTAGLAACSGSEAPVDNSAATPLPTTQPLQAVENAILAANTQDYEQANQLLDVSSLAESADSEAVVEYWNWLTSNQRVAQVEINIEETQADAQRLFITLQNDNYPTQQVGFWIRWQGDRWAAFEEGN